MPRGRTRRATTRRTKADKEKEEAESATTTPAGSANNSDDDDDDEPENNSKTATTTAKAAPVTRRSRRARKPTSKVVGSAGGRKNAAPSANSNKRGAAKKKVEDEDGSNDEEDNDNGSEGEDDKKDQVEEDEEEETERSGKDDLEDDTSKKKEADDDESEDEEEDSSKKGDAEDNDDDDDSADDDKPIASLAKGGRRAAAVPAKSKKGTKASKAAAAKPATGRRATRGSSRTLSEGDEESDHKASAKNKKTPVTRRRKRGVSAKSSEDESLASGSKGKRARTTRKTRGKSKNESDNDSEDDNDDDEKGESSDNNEKGADDMSVEAGDDAAGAKGSGKDNDSAEDEDSDDDGEEDEKATSTGRRTRGRQPKKAKTTVAATDKQTGKSKQQRGNQAADKKKEREKEAGKPATRKKRTRGAAKKQQGSSSDEGESSPEEDGDSTNEKTDFKKKTTKKTGTRNYKDDDSHPDESEGGDEDSKNSESESEYSKTSANKTSVGRKTRNNIRSQKQSSSDADEAMSTIDKEEPTEDDTGKDQQKAKVSSEEKWKDHMGTAEPEAKGQPNDPPEKDEVIAIDDEDDVDNSDKSSEVEKDNNKVGEKNATDEIKSADSADDTGKDEEVTVVIGTDTRIKQDPPDEKGDSGDASEIQEPNKTVDVSVEKNAKSDPVGVKEGKAGADVVKMEEAPKEEQIVPKELGSADMAGKTDQEGTAEDPSRNSVSSKTERRISSTDAPTTLANFGKGEIEEGGSGDVVEHSEDQPGSIDEVDNKMEIAQGENATEKTSVAPPKIQQSTEAQETDSTRGEQGSSADVGKANEKQETEFRKDESTTLQSPVEVTKKSASVEIQRAEAINDGSIPLKEKMSNETVDEGEVSTAPVNGASGNTNAEVSQESLSNGALSSDAPKDSPGGLTKKSTGPAVNAEGGFAEQNTGESGVDDGDREKIIETEASEEPDALALASKQADSTPKSPLADTARSDAANEKAALESIISKSLPEDKPELLPVHAESAGDKAIVAASSGNIVTGSQIEGVEEKAPENTATPSKGMNFAPSTPPTTTPPQPLVAMQIRDGATKDIPDQGVVLTDLHGPDKPTEEDEGSAMEVDETNHTEVKRPLEANIEEVGNAKALPPAKRSRVLSDAEWVSSSSELKAHGSDVPVEPEKPPEPIDEIHVKRCDLDKIKAMLFSAGSLEHRGRGFEKMFSEYWGAISLIVVGDQDAKIMAKLRKVVRSFLKTKRLRRLHNRLILGKFG